MKKKIKNFEIFHVGGGGGGVKRYYANFPSDIRGLATSASQKMVDAMEVRLAWSANGPTHRMLIVRAVVCVGGGTSHRHSVKNIVNRADHEDIKMTRFVFPTF